MLSTHLFAQKNMGIGVKLGSVAGLNVKYFLNNIVSLDNEFSWDVRSFVMVEPGLSYHFSGYFDEWIFYPFLGMGLLGGKSIGDAADFHRKSKDYFWGGLVKVGLSIPISSIDVTMVSRFRMKFYPEVTPDFTPTIIVRYWF